MSKEIAVSFVIPVYKKPPEVFERCLTSLFKSTLKDIEVICVFDGPNEDLEKVARKFPKVIVNVQEHGGACAARNAGFRMATGRYVVAWDADCFIKPDAAKRWIQEFEAVPDADFVYTGYEFAGGVGGFDSEIFNPYSLTCGNYISSMSPIKREKAHEWDESLKAGQDWDYWLTGVERGLKGVFIPGSSFITAHGDGISSEHWNLANREKTIKTIRDKHGIVNRDIGVYSLNYPQKAVKIAEILGADLIKETGPDYNAYKTIICYGYGFLSRFEGIPDSVTKIQYWLPGEIEGLREAKYPVVMETIRVAKGVINFCNTDYERNMLSELGITAEVLPLPFSAKDRESTQTELPKEFSVLVLTDDAYGKLLKELHVDLPHIKFGFNAGKAEDYSAVISFYRFAAIDEPVLHALINGRHVISNIQAPFCGFIDPAQEWEGFKKDLYERIRLVRSLPFNQAAKDYYLSLSNQEKFITRIKSCSKPVLEVL